MHSRIVRFVKDDLTDSPKMYVARKWNTFITSFVAKASKVCYARMTWILSG